MRRILLAVVAVLLVSSELHASQQWHRTLAAAQADAKKKNALIFVELYADWCGWCKKMDLEVFPAAVFKKATKDMVFLRLDVEDRGEGSQFMAKHSVGSLPTILLVRPDGMVAGMVQGYAAADKYVEKINTTLKTYSEFNARVKNEASIAGDPQKRFDLAKEFFARKGFVDAEKRFASLAWAEKVPAAIRADAAYHLALTQANQAQWDKSLATLQKMLVAHPKGEAAEQARILIAENYYQQRKFQAAIDEFRRFKQIFPNSPRNADIDRILPRLEMQARMAGQ